MRNLLPGPRQALLPLPLPLLDRALLQTEALRHLRSVAVLGMLRVRVKCKLVGRGRSTRARLQPAALETRPLIRGAAATLQPRQRMRLRERGQTRM